MSTQAKNWTISKVITGHGGFGLGERWIYELADGRSSQDSFRTSSDAASAAKRAWNRRRATASPAEPPVTGPGMTPEPGANQ